MALKVGKLKVEEWKGGKRVREWVSVGVREVEEWKSGKVRRSVDCAYWDNGHLARCEERMALTDFAYSTTLYHTNGVSNCKFR